MNNLTLHGLYPCQSDYISWANTLYSSNLSQLRNRLTVNEDGEINLRSKTIAEVAGEKLLKPIVDNVYGITSTLWNIPTRIAKAFSADKLVSKKTKKIPCITELTLGTLSTVVTKNPIFLTPFLTCIMPSTLAQEIDNCAEVNSIPCTKNSKEYDIFFNLSTIKKFPREEIENLKKHLDNGDRASFNDLIKSHGEKIIVKIESELRKAHHTIYLSVSDIEIEYDYRTLIGELFNKHQKFLMKEKPLSQKAEKEENIKKLFNELISVLDEKKYKNLIESSLTHLLNERFLRFTASGLLDSAPLVKLKLEHLVTLNADPEINRDISVEEIFRRAILEFNYQKLSKIKDSIDISEVMKICSQSQDYLGKIKSKEIILFIGRTGDGKSLSICSLQGNKVQVVFNRFHQQVYDCTSDQKKTPKVGISISDSETLFTQCFSVPGKDNSKLLFCDTPGFKDSRGEGYELCGALSIDQAIKNAKSIRAVVLTIPFHAVWDVKGGVVVDLIEMLSELIPNLFKNKGKGVFLLVTKHDTFQEIDLKKAIETHAQSQNSDLRNKEIWALVSHMYAAGRVKRIDIGNAVRADELLRDFKSSPGLTLGDLSSLMQTERLKKKYANKMEILANLWTEKIMKKYLIVIPSALFIFEFMQYDGRLVERGIDELRIDKRNLAIILRTHWPVAKALYEFSKLADEKLIHCAEYKKFFEENEKKLLEESAKDLGF